MKALLLLLTLFRTQPTVDSAVHECVNVFYDRGPEGYWIGRTHAIFLQNLLGHFPQLQQIVSPIELYQKGDTERCRATFYVASYFENKIPADFLDDFAHTKNHVAWLGYSIWKSDVEALFGHRYVGLTKLSTDQPDAEGKPSFFRFVDYKGETFSKFADYSLTDPSKFLAPFEQVELSETRPGTAQVLAWARHSATDRRIPYALRSANRFYVADIPFSYMHEADRYLVFSDLLFDILDLPAKNEHLGFVRMEDVSPLSPLPYVLEMADVLKKYSVRSNISLIPIFSDPLHLFSQNESDSFVPMDRKPEFVELIHELSQHDFAFVWHGVTHQHDVTKNPHSGISGEDFEYWDAVNNRPVPEDSAPWVLDRFQDGLYSILKAGLPAPTAWLTPHYQASPLDYLIFARIFPWNVGRVIYFNFRASNVPPSDSPALWLSDLDPEKARARKAAFANMKIEVDPIAPWNGQFFPYQIDGDIYGQRLVPENLGNSQPYIGDHVLRVRTPQQMLADAKRNLVIRDSWASFFYHPYLFRPFRDGGRGAFPGDAQEFETLIRQIKELGYHFINADDLPSRVGPLRPEPIYRGTKP